MGHGIDTAQARSTGYELWMQRLLRCAARVGAEGEIPVAAAVLDQEGRCIGWGSNRRERLQDPLGHAELVAIRQASRVLDDWRLNSCTLLVTLEPCPMCAGALVQARLGTLVFAAPDPKRGAVGGCLDLVNHASAHHHMRVISGVAADQAGELLSGWFRRRRRPTSGRWLQAGRLGAPS
ncbi:nucleoside deaminase [Cyanobium sp. NIES-981]|uniref:nucleoside deaminase n=1 Tax=Cyanobium sp. NIES-981 TaxID=1851505 RepID=UPI0007DE0EAB|nr:nucleoside deaminase [Cyanobium sp. NIES-981]SBO42357.1 tRNA-specific adenosine deaminase [Cyanobium sp. NIES-981]